MVIRPGRWFRLLGLLLALAPSPAAAQNPTRDWSPDDRVVLTDFARITALAAGLERVYVASPISLAIWRPQLHRWDPPVAPPAGVTLAAAFAGLVDPLDNSLWLALPDGWLHYQPDLRTWDGGTVPEGVHSIAFDQYAPAIGLYLRTGAGWMLVPRGSSAAMPSGAPSQPVQPATVADALAANPALQAFSSQVLLGPNLRQARYTAAAPSPDRQGWYLGTSGVGLLYLPTGSAFPQAMPFGLAGSRVGAVLAVPGGVWAATERTAEADAALTFVASDLSRFDALRGRRATGMPFDQVLRLVGQGSLLWAATESGVARIDPTDPEAIRMVDEGRGLPDPRIYSLLSYRGRLTAGTRHGIARITDSLKARRLAPEFADEGLALAGRGDSLFVGTPIGIFVLPSDSAPLVRLPGLGASPTLQVPVVRLAWLADTLVGLTRDQLLWRNPAGSWTLGPPLSATLGRLRDLVPDGDGFWVAGDRGIGYVRLNTPPIRPLFEGDLPAPPTGLAVDREYLWVATLSGLVRFRLDAVRP